MSKVLEFQKSLSTRRFHNSPCNIQNPPLFKQFLLSGDDFDAARVPPDPLIATLCIFCSVININARTQDSCSPRPCPCGLDYIWFIFSVLFRLTVLQGEPRTTDGTIKTNIWILHVFEMLKSYCSIFQLISCTNIDPSLKLRKQWNKYSC